MKIALLLSIVCAALITGGCASERGGTSDEYERSSTMQTEPAMTDPSLPQNPSMNPYIGPVVPPP
jgi:PBP1b-binding outer membrane lipoprotein LpoB